MATDTAEHFAPGGAAGPTRVSLRAAYLAALLVAVLLILWAWSRGLTGPYHFDDYATPLNDPASQSLAAWREHFAVTLRPVTKLSYALEAEAGLNREPALRRVFSLAMLLASGVLLALLAARLAPYSDRYTTTAFIAAFIALTWLAHPVHADSVLLLSGRTAVLSGMLVLAALLALDHRRAWLAGAFFLLACLARETALAGLLPLVVLAASRSGASSRSALRELAPALLGGALVLAWILTTQRYLHLAEFSFLGRPFWGSLFAQVGAVPVGLGLLFSPAGLSIDYGIALPGEVSNPLFVLGAACYLAAIVGTVLLLHRARAAAVGLAIWLAALLPTQSVVPKLDALTNRPLSLALLGLLLASVPALAGAVRWSRSARIRVGTGENPGLLRAAPPLTAACCALTLLLLLTSATLDRGLLYSSELSLWEDAAIKSRTNARPHLQYAVLLYNAGRHAEARDALSAARRIDPFSSNVALFSRLHRDDEVVP